MKEPNFGLMAYNLLEAATALAAILDQPIEGMCINVNRDFVSELIVRMQLNAKAVADELMFIHDEKGGVE